ncbi:MAG: DUF2812 domain-containing protein [Leptolinea sp.]|jgi:hypothetical protein|nr:DUF2812 domain-containing protein [Leptolinea sp.]
MNATTFRKFRWFWIWEDDREENWLEEMSRQGNHMQQVVFPGVYTFEKGPRREYVYRLDYLSGQKTEEYLTLFRDAGWTYLGRLNSWQYFRKEVKNAEKPEIFTDNESKIEKYRRIISLLAALLPLMVVNLINCGGRADQPVWLVLTIFFAVFLVVFLYGLWRLFHRMNQIKQI